MSKQTDLARENLEQAILLTADDGAAKLLRGLVGMLCLLYDTECENDHGSFSTRISQLVQENEQWKNLAEAGRTAEKEEESDGPVS